MNTNIKYLKDESGNTISPVTNIRSIFNDNGISLLDIFYPVGSYYETSNKDFNPNTAWGGTWVQDTVGRCTVGANTYEDPSVTKNGLVNLSVNSVTGNANTTVNFNHTHAQTHTFKCKYTNTIGRFEISTRRNWSCRYGSYTTK